MRNLIPALLALTSAVATVPAHAAASYDGCTGFITSLPVVLSQQGVWCLKNDLATAMTSGNAITVTANNVTIDCNEFKLGGLAGGTGSSTKGINSLDRQNTIVRGCNLRGFDTGISIFNGGGHIVEDNRLDGSLRIGIFLWTNASVIRRNTVSDTGGSTADPGPAYGIIAYESVDIFDNHVNGVDAGAASESAYGIFADTIEGAITGNRVKGIHPSGAATGYGIYVQGPQVIVEGNYVQHTGPNTDTAIWCGDGSTAAVRNVITVFDTGVANCMDVDNVVNN